MGDTEYLAAFQQIVMPVAYEVCVFVSCMPIIHADVVYYQGDMNDTVFSSSTMLHMSIVTRADSSQLCHSDISIHVPLGSLPSLFTRSTVNFSVIVSQWNA